MLSMSFSWFQEPATPIMDGIIDLHNYIFFYLILVLIVVMWGLFYVIFLNYSCTNPKTLVDLKFRDVLVAGNMVTHGVNLEIIWTILPSLLLVLIVVPSFALLYSMDEVMYPALTVKVIGHQWYWSYEYSEGAGESYPKFSSYLVEVDDLEKGDFRLLETTVPVILPIDTFIRVLVTASDVLHSWAVPALGIKIDAVPGRLNQGFIYLKREGSYYGQCSELCGINHGYMPIEVRGLSYSEYREAVDLVFDYKLIDTTIPDMVYTGQHKGIPVDINQHNDTPILDTTDTDTTDTNTVSNTEDANSAVKK